MVISQISIRSIQQRDSGRCKWIRPRNPVPIETYILVYLKESGTKMVTDEFRAVNQRHALRFVRVRLNIGDRTPLSTQVFLAAGGIKIMQGDDQIYPPKPAQQPVQ